MNGQKEVRFDLYCSRCEHWDKNNEYKNPCDDCMDNPTNVYTDRPVYFEERKQ